MTTQDQPLAVELQGIEKRFPGVIANYEVSLRVRPGTIHAIVGENGAGKSTLMKTLYGMHQPDAGTIRVGGVEMRFKSPSEAIAAGIGMVHQHFMLADNFTVLENIILGSEPVNGIRLDIKGARERILDTLPHGGHPRRPGHDGERARRRPAPTRRDPQGAVPRRPCAHPRRADRCARPAGGRRAVRPTSSASLPAAPR